MADYLELAPFIIDAEGGYVNNPSDRGGETNRGITLTTWNSFFGNNAVQPNLFRNSYQQFRMMDWADWSIIFKKGFWDKCLADKIECQPVANIIVDWVWGSGQYFPELDIQKLINTIFNKHLAEDGIFGDATIAALNSCNHSIFYESLIARRKQYYKDIVMFAQTRNDHSQDKFLQGWLSRVDNLVKYNANFKS